MPIWAIRLIATAPAIAAESIYFFFFAAFFAGAFFAAFFAALAIVDRPSVLILNTQRLLTRLESRPLDIEQNKVFSQTKFAGC
jgi:hypothetical protein